MPHRDRALWVLAVILSMTLLIAPALWNGFPLLQYDTGSYLSPWYEGKVLINRSILYGLFLISGVRFDFWPVLLVQSALTTWVLALTLRVHGFGNRPLVLLGTIVALCLLTTLPWLTAILLTDIFAGLGVLALYLLLLRDASLNRPERAGLVALVAVAGATHSATLALLMALSACALFYALVDRRRLPPRRLSYAVGGLAIAAVIVLAGNFLVAGRTGWTPGGYSLSFGRMLQDGIVKTYLDDHCPDPTLRLCAYKDELPHDADDFFWGGGIFNKLGRFTGYRDEMHRIALAALAEYPLLQIESIVSETAKQLVEVNTGAGVVKWVWDSYTIIKGYAPRLTPAIDASRQHRGELNFDTVNSFQVPIAWLTMALMPVVVIVALRRRGFGEIGELAATAAIAVLANAAVFGIFATAHNRYGSRIAWIAPFVVILALAHVIEARRALR